MLILRTTPQKLAAEFVATAAFCAIGVGSVLAAFASLPIDSGSTPDLVGIALAHGLAIAALVTAAGHISGGHLNPAVTAGLVVTRRTPPLLGAMYLVAQLAGAVVGSLLVHLAVPDSAIPGPSDFEATVPRLADSLSGSQGVLLEAILTFFLMWVVMSVNVDRDGAWFRVAALPIGLAVTAGQFVGGPFTGGALNPARAFGPAAVAGEWQDQWVYWVGPVAGALVAALLYVATARPRYHEAPR